MAQLPGGGGHVHIGFLGQSPSPQPHPSPAPSCARKASKHNTRQGFSPAPALGSAALEEKGALHCPPARQLSGGPTHLSLRRDEAREGRASASLQAPTSVMLFWDKLQRHSEGKGSGPSLMAFPIRAHPAGAELGNSHFPTRWPEQQTHVCLPGGETRATCRFLVNTDAVPCLAAWDVGVTIQRELMCPPHLFYDSMASFSSLETTFPH